MAKTDRNKKQTLQCYVKDRENMVHHFSPRGYEILSEEFTSWLEHMKPELLDTDELELEIYGDSFSKEEREAIHRAARYNYSLLYTETLNSLKKIEVRLGWFLISMIVSSILLFMVQKEKSEVLVQLGYLPFWFFGYRFVTYIVLDLPELLRDKKWYALLSGMKLTFVDENGQRDSYGDGKPAVAGEKLLNMYFMEGNTLQLECAAENSDELLSVYEGEAGTRISDDLASYMEKAVPFINEENRVKLGVSGCLLSGDEMKKVQTGVRNYFALREAETDLDVKDNNTRIIRFSIGLLLACFALCFIGKKVGVAYHEVIMITLWFFADYLVEYILLTPRELSELKKKWHRMEDMEVYQITRKN